MEAWFNVKKEDVIDILERTKDSFPWGDHPDEKYYCLIFYEDNIIRINVDMFYETEDGSYECCRYYTDKLADTISEYEKITDEQISIKAYNAWCSGAR